MKNRITSARTAAEKSTTVETQNPSSHSNGNTFVVSSFSLSTDDYNYIGFVLNIGFKNLVTGCCYYSQVVQALKA
jgi:hypothetical protein